MCRYEHDNIVGIAHGNVDRIFFVHMFLMFPFPLILQSVNQASRVGNVISAAQKYYMDGDDVVKTNPVRVTKSVYNSFTSRGRPNFIF